MTIIAVHSSVNTRRKLLILKLSSTESAIGNPTVQEIRNYDLQDSVANPGYILGVIDWHGMTVPVVEGYIGLSQGAARNEPALVIRQCRR
jgi:chemotaxis signal transduction protein